MLSRLQREKRSGRVAKANSNRCQEGRWAEGSGRSRLRPGTLSVSFTTLQQNPWQGHLSSKEILIWIHSSRDSGPGVSGPISWSHGENIHSVGNARRMDAHNWRLWRVERGSHKSCRGHSPLGTPHRLLKDHRERCWDQTFTLQTTTGMEERARSEKTPVHTAQTRCRGWFCNGKAFYKE